MSPTSVSPTTAASNRFVADHLDAASALGESLPALVADPKLFVATLSRGFAALGDASYAAGVRSVTPGLGPIFGVRQPLMDVTHRAFRRGTRQTPPVQLLDCVAALFHEEQREMRWFGIWMVGRLLPADPDRAWQLLRQAAARADDWITVDTLARPFGEGVLRDPARWAELEKLTSSPSRWERRLVGSTLATMPSAPRALGGRGPAVAKRGLDLVGSLIGDAEPDVQKALSWALRSLVLVDAPAVTRLLETETATARATADGNRAWVIRDALPKVPAETAARLRDALDGIRRRPGSHSTSLASGATPATRAGRPAAAFLRSTAP